MASLLSRSRPLYLVDLNCFRPDEELMVSKRDIETLWKDSMVIDDLVMLTCVALACYHLFL